MSEKGMRSAIAHIDLDALRHNYCLAKSHAPQSRAFAVLKADAYGHGLLGVARGLQSLADGYAVCNLEEARSLREAGIRQPILVLHGFYHAEEMAEFERLDLQPALHHAWQLDALARHTFSKPLSVWLKIDSGMGRLGFSLASAAAAWQGLENLSGIRRPIGIMTHLAAADDPADDYTQRQLQRFLNFAGKLKAPLSIANSAGLLAWPISRAAWNRPGIMLYGANPFVNGSAVAHGLKAVMRLQTRLIAINRHSRGDAIGYGHTWHCPEDMPVGIAAIGYGDGYPRHAPTGTPILVRGQRAALIGRVSMDSIAIDLRAIKNAAIGDDIELWGYDLPVDEVAAKAGTLAYELLCSAAKVRHVYQPSLDAMSSSPGVTA